MISRRAFAKLLAATPFMGAIKPAPAMEGSPVLKSVVSRLYGVGESSMTVKEVL